MYLNINIIANELKTNFKSVLSTAGQYGLMLFFAVVTVLAFFYNATHLGTVPLILLTITYLLFMASFASMYFLYKLLARIKVLDIDFFGVVAVGAILYSVI